MRELLKIWFWAALVFSGWALLAGALDQADEANARCIVVHCT
ncbi:hypothetical protein [Paraburkholderia terrae]|nr:hypothetical protein [Paraburkholderia terrae]GJH05003.1 hypothetical protein CBA19C8_30620 [Paraburkholderia terrae]